MLDVQISLMINLNPIQSRWVEIAEEFDQKSGGRSDQKLLQEMLNKKTDKFIKLALDSKKANLVLYQFESDYPGTPDKILHDKLFRLATALDSIKPTSKVNHVLLKNLLDGSLMKCFPL